MVSLAQGRHLADIEGMQPSLVRLFATAQTIPAKWHVRIQAAFQKHVDNAVSKTVNLPNQATRYDVASIYMQAYKEGLKGITIYRDGSRRSQPLSGKVNLRLLKQCLGRGQM